MSQYSVLGQVELDQKAVDQALIDLEKSKKQASLILKEEMKSYDLNRLPPHYQEMIKTQLYGAKVTPEALKVMKEKYEAILKTTLAHASKGTGGNLNLLNQAFKSAIQGKSILSKTKIPYKRMKNSSAPKTESFRNEKIAKKLSKSLSPSEVRANEKLLFSQYVDDNKKNNKKDLDNTIFHRHSEVYLNEIYKKLK